MNKRLMAFLSVFITTFIVGVNVAHASGIPENATTADCSYDVLNTMSGVVYLRAKWALSEYECPAGHYLPKNHTNCLDDDTICAPDHYCAGGTYTYNTTQDQGAQTCPNGLKSPAGSKNENDCGHLLHIGEETLYLSKNKQTGRPSLAIRVGEQTYYANMTPISEGAKPITNGASSKLHVISNGVHYTVHDSSVE